MNFLLLGGKSKKTLFAIDFKTRIKIFILQELNNRLVIKRKIIFPIVGRIYQFFSFRFQRKGKNKEMKEMKEQMNRRKGKRNLRNNERKK